jgi:hypothetical protein
MRKWGKWGYRDIGKFNYTRRQTAAGIRKIFARTGF